MRQIAQALDVSLALFWAKEKVGNENDLSKRIPDLIPYLQGPPGVGKTALVKAVVEARGLKVWTVSASTLDPTDLGGVPVLSRDGEKLRWGLPAWATKALEEGVKVVFFDDLPEASSAVMGAMLDFILSSRIAGERLPFHRVAAGNPPGQSVQGSPLPWAVANRLVHLQVEEDITWMVEGFQRGFHRLVEEALRPWPQPGVIFAEVEKAEKALAGFLYGRRPTFRPPEDPVQGGGPWASPRSLHIGAVGAAVALALGYGWELAMTMAMGAAGGLGGEFVHFMRHLDLPRPEEVLQNPQRLPEDLDRLYMAAAAAMDLARERLPGSKREGYKLLRYLAEERGLADLALQVGGPFVRRARELGITPTLEEMGDRLLRLVAEVNALK